MDKKGSRSKQATAKGHAVDSKKNQADAIGGKHSRFREPNGGTYAATKPETSRKPNNFCNKNNIKVPKPKGTNHAGGQSGNEVTRVEPTDAELGSVFKQGSKKLQTNFKFPERDHGGQMRLGGSNGAKSKHRKHKYNKEQFLQATCQFVVKSTGDYKQHASSPDILVDWNLIEQVNVHVSDSVACPICLYSPVAAKMTRCGHVYCWSCILHYLSLSDKSWRKCPICYEAIHKNDLKSAVLIYHPALNVKETITFKLMKRHRDSFVVYRADEPAIDESKYIFDVSDEQTSNVYCKLLLANQSDVMAIIDRERTQLEVLLAEDADCPERCFIEEALVLLGQREKELLGGKNVPELTYHSKSDNRPSPEGISDDIHEITEANRRRFESASSEDLEDTGVTSEDLVMSPSAKNHQGAPQKYFYFYQASDGQHIYMNPINAQMLQHTYGSLEFAPLEIRGRIVEKETTSVSEEFRYRVRHLAHLPVSCSYEVAEIKMTPPLVSREALDYYQGKLDSRKKRRQKRAREEKRLEKRIIEVENKMMGRIPEHNICLTSTAEFPEFTDAMQRIDAELGTSPSSRSSLSDTFTASSSVLASSPDTEYAGPSFAKMLSTAKKQPQLTTWPELRENKTSVSSLRLINVTGSKPSSVYQPKHRQESDSESEDYIQAPRCSTLLGDALNVAFANVSIKREDECVDVQNGKKKNKRRKQKVLLTTCRAFT